ncbi:hypothetical protein PLESTF_000046000 [Pleodorina starrii]|nr:hypothetical protein PLESTF_000046000 [Pleodorina starrii]
MSLSDVEPCIFRNSKSSKVFRLSDVVHAPDPAGQPARQAAGNRAAAAGAQGGPDPTGPTRHERRGAYGALAQPQYAAGRPTVAAAAGPAQAPTGAPARRQPPSPRQLNQTAAATAGPIRAAAPSDHRPDPRSTARNVHTGRDGSAGGDQRPATAAPPAAAAAAAPAAAAPAGGAALAPVPGPGGGRDPREYMRLVRSRVASMIEADLGLRLEPPEEPAAPRTGAGDVEQQRQDRRPGAQQQLRQQQQQQADVRGCGGGRGGAAQARGLPGAGAREASGTAAVPQEQQPPQRQQQREQLQRRHHQQQQEQWTDGAFDLTELDGSMRSGDDRDAPHGDGGQRRGGDGGGGGADGDAGACGRAGVRTVRTEGPVADRGGDGDRKQRNAGSGSPSRRISTAAGLAAQGQQHPRGPKCAREPRAQEPQQQGGAAARQGPSSRLFGDEQQLAELDSWDWGGGAAAATGPSARGARGTAAAATAAEGGGGGAEAAEGEEDGQARKRRRHAAQGPATSVSLTGTLRSTSASSGEPSSASPGDRAKELLWGRRPTGQHRRADPQASSPGGTDSRRQLPPRSTECSEEVRREGWRPSQIRRDQRRELADCVLSLSTGVADGAQPSEQHHYHRHHHHRHDPKHRQRRKAAAAAAGALCNGDDSEDDDNLMRLLPGLPEGSPSPRPRDTGRQPAGRVRGCGGQGGPHAAAGGVALRRQPQRQLQAGREAGPSSPLSSPNWMLDDDGADDNDGGCGGGGGAAPRRHGGGLQLHESEAAPEVGGMGVYDDEEMEGQAAAGCVDEESQWWDAMAPDFAAEMAAAGAEQTMAATAPRRRYAGRRSVEPDAGLLGDWLGGPEFGLQDAGDQDAQEGLFGNVDEQDEHEQLLGFSGDWELGAGGELAGGGGDRGGHVGRRSRGAGPVSRVGPGCGAEAPGEFCWLEEGEEQDGFGAGALVGSRGGGAAWEEEFGGAAAEGVPVGEAAGAGDGSPRLDGDEQAGEDEEEWLLHGNRRARTPQLRPHLQRQQQQGQGRQQGGWQQQQQQTQWQQQQQLGRGRGQLRRPEPEMRPGLDATRSWMEGSDGFDADPGVAPRGLGAGPAGRGAGVAHTGGEGQRRAGAAAGSIAARFAGSYPFS